MGIARVTTSRITDAISGYGPQVTVSLALFLLITILGAAKHSGSTLLQSVTCQVIGFKKGSVWAVIQLTTDNGESIVISADELEILLEAAAANYEASGEADTSYSFDPSTLQIELAQKISVTYDVTAKVTHNNVIMEWDDQLLDPTSALYQTVSGYPVQIQTVGQIRDKETTSHNLASIAFDRDILGAAKHSGSTLLQSVTCQVTGFTKGSVWVVIQLTIENTENFIISADELESLLKSEIAIYKLSGEADITYAFDESTLEVMSAQKISITYDVKMQVSLNQKPVDWDDRLSDRNSAIFQLLAKALCEFVLGAARRSSLRLLQSSSCIVVRFFKGSVWAEADVIPPQNETTILTKEQVINELSTGAKNYIASGEPNITYTFNSTNLEVQIVTTTTVQTTTTTTTKSPVKTNATLSTGTSPIRFVTFHFNWQKIYWTSEYSGSENLRGSTVIFKQFQRGSVYGYTELQTQSTSVMSTDEVANALLKGSKSYITASGTDVNKLVWFGNTTVPLVSDITPRTTCSEYNTTCSTHGQCVDTLNGHLCLCNTMWRDANPSDPGTNCTLSVGAIVLILALIMLVGFLLTAILLGTVRAQQFSYLWT
ncbi:hypothetical protein FBUS_02188 [Fasciolopsis buskii]|uniref:EGF-like domain-containing protein n=1 Tax=Fasciolopsis buskii TaxID=27845 RepID=A0A8E0S4N4_9TREM|nr:hypothetical protein FBUS_02188 [Fasciolopsis buski]